MSTGSGARNVVLVHGAFVDGSSWRAVYQLLTDDGYRVAVVQNPTLSLSGDAVATRLVIDAQDGPVVLVGHSYGGAVITEAGTHDKVVALVYIAAFAPDGGESVDALGGNPDAAGSPIVAAPGGFYFQDREKFHASFGADLSGRDAAFLADSQVPWGADAMTGTVTEPAWRVKPSWSGPATEDRMITAAAQRAMAQRAGATTVEVTASHAVYMSQQRAVAALIRTACAEAIACLAPDWLGEPYAMKVFFANSVPRLGQYPQLPLQVLPRPTRRTISSVEPSRPQLLSQGWPHPP